MTYYVFALLWLVTSCRSTHHADPTPPAPVEVHDLSEAEARDRAARVSNVRYELSLDLDESSEAFRGTNIIQFSLKTVDRPLRLDFYEGSVSALKVNGQDAGLAAKHRYWIDLPAAALKAGENEVEISYASNYTRAGLGLHRFVDPETKQIFIYSKLEPYDANRVFPCFDQPDLRATWALTVRAPAAWQVMHTTRESSVVPEPNGWRRWSFPKTPAIATYLFSMHAGPYRIWTDRYRDIPLRLWARPSLAKYVRAKEWFGWTKKGLEFYGRYFGYPYPFQKYDQIFVPEAAGAMENVAAVTFVESFLNRSAPTRAQSRSAASVMLHEMAHMWFGDLVTMKWWNDLWLNESFATYMAALALDRVTEFKESWQKFFVDSKTFAYLEDGFVTTHPIETPVAGVRDGLAAFDQITYGKGASVLKQLRAYVGPRGFDEGVRRYIRAHQFANTTRADFIAALQTQTPKDLTAWAEVWLRQSGTDRVEARWTCVGPRLREITLRTEVSPGRRFRPQVFKVGLYPARAVVEVDLTAPEQVVHGDWACPAFVYPNVEDHAFANVRLDQTSREWAITHLNDLRDPLLRAQVWRDLWEMVRAGDMPLNYYVTVVERHLPQEEDEIVLGQVVGSVVGHYTYSILQYWPPAAAESRDAFVGRMEALFLSRLNAATAQSTRMFWLDRYATLARTPEGLAQLTRWLDGRDTVKGLDLDVDRRWAMVHRLARFRPAEAKPFVERLKAEDPGDRGRRFAMMAEAAVPDADVKRRWVDALSVTKPEYSMPEYRGVMSVLFPFEQEDLKRPFDGVITDFMRASAQSGEDQYLGQYATFMSPLRCEPGPAAAFRKLIESTDFPLTVRRSMLIRLQEDERCQLVRSRFRL